jgi:hypothetical protein
MCARIRIDIDTEGSEVQSSPCAQDERQRGTRTPLRTKSTFILASQCDDSTVVIYNPVPDEGVIYLIRPYFITALFVPTGTETVLIPRVTAFPIGANPTLISPDAVVNHDVFTVGITSDATGLHLVGPLHYFTLTVTKTTTSGVLNYRHPVIVPEPQDAPPFTPNPISGPDCIVDNNFSNGDSLIFFVSFPIETNTSSPYYHASDSAASEAYLWKKIKSTCPADPNGPGNLFMPVIPVP